MQRYDVVYGGDSNAPNCYISHHFCREWEDGEGCYGTNPDHGFTWEEACLEVAEWHEQQAKVWKEKSAKTEETENDL